MAKFWSVNLMAHRQPFRCDNHDKYVLENCLMLYEKEKKINSCPGHSYNYGKICRPDAAQEPRNTERADQVSGSMGWVPHRHFLVMLS